MLINSKIANRIGVFAMTLFVIATFQIFAAAQCESATDAKMVSDMYAKIKADKALASQIRHINVSSLNLVIKLQGYTTRKSEYDRLVGFAMKMACVKMVNTNELSPTAPDSGTGGTNQRLAGGGCASGMKQCGDICIPDSDVCNIDAYLGFNYEPFRFLDITALNGFGYTNVAACGIN